MMWGQSVVKVMARSSNDRISMGSGVVVAPNRVATNCHVTRPGISIIVSKGIRRYRVVGQSSNPELDVCVLHTIDLSLPSAQLGSLTDAHPGDEVFIFGFASAVGLGMVRGSVRSLHPFREDFVLETDAGFMRGTSGGAVFSANGLLIALPTFMLRDRDQGQFYAVPVEWVIQVLNQEPDPISPFSRQAFWETGGFKRNSQ